MAVTITEQLTKLNQLRQQLAANLTTKGVTATATEKFNTLVPKVLGDFQRRNSDHNRVI